MKKEVYLDNAATTWPKPETTKKYVDSYFTSALGSPSYALT